jgi:ubiquinone/menaquinone biosynthesis C-methylase UbiE
MRLRNVETPELDGECHETLDEATFDVVISRVELICFPNQQGALRGLRRCLKSCGRISVMV